MYAAGEDLLPEVLLSVLEKERRLQLRLTAITALMLCRDAKLVGPTLINLLDDPHVEIRAAAICALYGAKPPEALPKLEKMLTGTRVGRYRSFLLDLIAAYRDEEAIRILGQFLQTALADNRYERDVSDAFGALETASGMRWGAAGAHDAEYYRQRSEEALKWWRLRRAAIARQTAAAQYKQLLDEYRGPVILPGELLDTYGRFVTATKEPTPEVFNEFCLPNSVEITVDPRPEKGRFYGRDLNLPFLKNEFASRILVLRNEDGKAFLIRTATSYIRFVDTAATGWKIYDYGDKPIE
jgi:hypothetical protein